MDTIIAAEPARVNKTLPSKSTQKRYTEAEIAATLDRLRRSHLRLDTTPRQRFRWEIFLSSMSPNAKLVSLALLELANGDGVAVETSQTLEIVTGLSKATIRRVRNELEGCPFVGAEPSKGRAPNVYRVHIPVETVSELASALSDFNPLTQSGFSLQPAHTERVEVEPTRSHRAGSVSNPLTQSGLRSPTRSHRAPDLVTILDQTILQESGFASNGSKVNLADPLGTESGMAKNSAENASAKIPSPAVPANDLQSQPGVIRAADIGHSPSFAAVLARAREMQPEIAAKLAALREASGTACLALDAPGSKLAEVSALESWLASDRDWALDIEPVLRRLGAKAKPGSVHSWDYFTDAITEANVRRKCPPPEPEPRRNGVLKFIDRALEPRTNRSKRPEGAGGLVRPYRG